jgi:hypothetical protein
MQDGVIDDRGAVIRICCSVRGGSMNGYQEGGGWDRYGAQRDIRTDGGGWRR